MATMAVSPKLSKIQQKVVSLVTERGGHWLPKKAEVVWVPDIFRVVTLRRAAFAAFRGEVPEDFVPRAKCGVRQCVAPEHAELAESPTRCAAVPFIGDLAPTTPKLPPVKLVAVPDAATTAPKSPGKFDPGLVRKVASMSGATLAQVRLATGLSPTEIVRIRGQLSR